ncbi:MAG: sulfite exporter TauE/SafE family protein [Flavobacteriales bacterium]|nr:sulfite exporter TauE/SafE family protein [Flavobacteriales bacterium]
MNELVLALLIALVAFAYAMVGHGGASGYLALMGIAGIAPETMRPSALILNVCVSGISFAQFARAGHFRWRVFWPFALMSAPLAFLGAGIPLDDAWYKRILGACLIVASLRLLGFFAPRSASIRQAPVVLALLIGGAIGMLSGILGIGGGVLLSPVLLLCSWADAKTAAAISALFIFTNSLAGLLGVHWSPAAFPPEATAWCMAAIAGGLLGSWVGARRAPEPRLRQALGVVLLLASIKLAWP